MLADSPDDTETEDVVSDVSGDVVADTGDVPQDVVADPCDLTGTWAVKTSAYALDTLVFQTQLSNNWYYYEIEDSGDEFVITGGYQCGIRVEGSASVTITSATTEALRARNSPIGRRGEFYLDGDQCHFSMERAFLVRGGIPELLPADPSQFQGDDALELLEESLPLPTSENLESQLDIEDDGEPGMAYQVGGAVSGSRNVAQRDWNEVFSSEAYPVFPGQTDDFEVQFVYDSAETMLSITGCDSDFGCGLLEAGSEVNPDGDHHTHFVRVDRATITGETPLETCFNVQDLIPFDSQ
ncbi:MAG: hypothetical protein ACJAYU_002505 [Bradymonadia bacterium]